MKRSPTVVPTLLYLFSAQLSFGTVFYSSPSLCLYGTIGKYTTSRLIISQPVERSHFVCVVLAPPSKKLHRRRWNTVISLAVMLERCSPRHSAAAHHGSGSGLGQVGFELQRHPEGLCVSSEGFARSTTGAPAASS